MAKTTQQSAAGTPRVIYLSQPAPPPEAPKPGRVHSSSVEVRIEGLGLGLGKANKPQELIKNSRHFAEFNPWVSLFTWLRLGFANYGFRLKPLEKGRKLDADWIEEDRLALLDALVEQVWLEWLPLWNVLVVWHDDDDLPVLLHPEDRDVIYSDAMGQQELKFRHNLSDSQINALTNPDRQKLYRENSQLTIVPDDPSGHHFRVLKRAPIGQGFGRPSLTSVLTACDTFASLEASDAMLAHESRRLYKRHLMGHEIRGGPFAGHSTHFLKKERAEANGKKFKGKVGVVETSDNFDHEVVFDLLPTKFFDAKKYEGTREHLFTWGAPLGQMLVTRGGVAPFLLDELRVQVEQDRRRVGPFLADLINRIFSPPVPVQVVWSNKVFRDARIAAELLRYGVQTGALSQPTFRHEAGYDEQEELANKTAEVAMKDEMKRPAYDAAHDSNKSAKPGKERGRPSKQAKA
jgi:hypothetical protein